jgi:perosamine synthetase
MAGPSWTEHEARFVTDAILNGGYEKAYYYIELFEKEFAKYLGRKYALMTPNCTTAIHLVLTGLFLIKLRIIPKQSLQ